MKNLVLPHFMKKEIQGILLAGYMDKDYILYLREKDIPIVLMGYDIISPPVDCIQCEDLLGAFNAVNFLISKGHQNIGLIAGAPEHYTPLLRMEGYKLALQRASIPLNPEIIVEDLPSSTKEFGYEATLKILRSYKEKIDAFFCVTDNYAAGCMKAIRELGYRIPDDFSVMGFDNMDWVDHLFPPLTTVKIPTPEMGKCGMKRLLEIVKNQSRGIIENPIKIMFPTEIIIRESVAGVRTKEEATV
jgi:LacI family transcriptional regulator